MKHLEIVVAVTDRARGGGKPFFSVIVVFSSPIADFNDKYGMVEAGSRVRFYHLVTGLISPIQLY